MLRVSYRYELPFGVGKSHVKHGVPARIIGGWSVAGFISADNGTPVTVSSPADFFTYFGGGNGQRPMATGQKASLDSLNTWMARLTSTPPLSPHAALFVWQREPHFAGCARAGNVNWDALIEKRFSITERVALDFRTELYNASTR